MTRSALKSLVSLVLLAAATMTFAAGLVLLTQFHMGLDSFRAEAAGLSRLAWLNLHRLSSLVALAALALHLTLNGRALLGRLRGALGARRARGSGVELVLYGVFGVVAVTGLTAWWLVGGSAPLQGPVPLGLLPHGRHALVDVHDLGGLVALALTAHHVGHRWSQLTRGIFKRRAPAGRPA